MFKKILSLAIAMMLIAGMCAIAVSAAQVEIVDGAADEAIAEVAADAPAEAGADAAAETGSGYVINFDASSADWQNYSYVSAHVFVYGGASFNSWGSKAEKGTDNGDGTWSFDLQTQADKGGEVALDGGALYAVVFYNSNEIETYQLLFDLSVCGDTAYTDNTKTENPVDSNKSSYTAYWRGQDSAAYGPVKQITSIGNVVGTCIPRNTTAYDMLVTFLSSDDKDGIGNAKNFSDRTGRSTDQEIIDYVKENLGLTDDQVADAIAASGKSFDWTGATSNTSDGGNSDNSGNSSNGGNGGTTPTTADGTPAQTATDSNGNVVAATDSNGNVVAATDASGKPVSGGTSTGGSSTSSANTNKTSTGTETTLLLIMLGVMVAAAGTIIFVRRKDF